MSALWRIHTFESVMQRSSPSHNACEARGENENIEKASDTDEQKHGSHRELNGLREARHR